MNPQDILSQNVLGSIATVSEDGSPWVTPLHVFSDGRAVYWFSSERADHSQNIAREPLASLVVWLPDTNEGPKGFYLNGTVAKLSEAESDQARTLVEARLGTIPAVFASAPAYKMSIGVKNEDKSRGKCWYFYT